MLWIKVKQGKETKEHGLVVAILYGVVQISLIRYKRRPKRNRE